MKPTPVPFMHLLGDEGIYTRLSDGCRGIMVARVPSVAPQHQADAQFIVRACNTHDELVAAATDARRMLHHLGMIHGHHSLKNEKPEIVRMYGALAAAIGKTEAKK